SSDVCSSDLRELDDLVGFFVNTLVMRTKIKGEQTIVELLHELRKVALDSYEHQDVPFERLVEEIQPERSLNRHPLFQVMFTLQNAPREKIRLRELTVEPVEMETAWTKFDLALYMSECEEGMKGWMLYRPELYEAGTIQRMLGHYQQV